jgi:hypothetical protein
MDTLPGEPRAQKIPVTPAELRARRKRSGSAATAFSHAVLLTGQPKVAEQIAVSALRKGAHSRTSIIAHARHLALKAYDHRQIQSEAASTDSKTLALQLARTRPGIELALLDLSSRYGLDQGTFSRVLGISSKEAFRRLRDVKEKWVDTLDPAMMAAFGPGSCSELAAILQDGIIEDLDEGNAEHGEEVADPLAARPTIAELQVLAPRVRAHAEECPVCEQRLKAMSSVTNLVSQTPIETVPNLVSAAAVNSRKRLPTSIALPPSINSGRIDPRRFRSATAAIVAVIALGGALWGAGSAFSDGESQSERVAKLIESAPTSSLLATPSTITAEDETFTIANNNEQSLRWSAVSSQEWLSVNPSNGELSGNQTVSVSIDTSLAPEDSQGFATITITGDDGSEQAVSYEN